MTRAPGDEEWRATNRAMWERGDDGLYRFPEGMYRFPLTYSLRARAD